MDSGHTAAYLAYFCLLLRRKKRMRGHKGCRWAFPSMPTQMLLLTKSFNIPVMNSQSASAQTPHWVFYSMFRCAQAVFFNEWLMRL